MYYPEQRYVSPLTVIRRECRLPEEAIGTVSVKQNVRVDVHDIVARGVIPSRYYILDAVQFFKLRKPDALDKLLFVDVKDVVQQGDLLAGKRENRGRRLFSPVQGVVVAIKNGRIILQEMPEVIDLPAGVRGRVVRVLPERGVNIETIGARVQGVWGNNRTAISVLRLLPETRLENLPEESLGVRYTGTTMLTRASLTEKGLQRAEARGLTGVIAPSMESALVEMALESHVVVVLTEGFGGMYMSHAVYNLLAEFDGDQIILDARKPERWEVRAPEIIVNIVPPEGEAPSRPNIMLTLREGMTVRVTRAPYAGLTGTVLDLPQLPVLLDNGLRIQCAQVELVIGETVFVPLANLEVLGR